MQIVEIDALSNGAHRNQTGGPSAPPDGWAVIPDDMGLESFPFGEVEVEKIKGVMTVTKWTPGVIPEKEPEEKPVTKLEQLRADVDFLSIMTGVKL